MAAAGFAEVWQSCASEAGEYAQGRAYAAIREALINTNDTAEGHVELCGSRKELSRSRICDQDVIFLVKALISSRKISTLDLSCNAISENGIETISEYLKDPNCTLSKLNLSHNDFEAASAELLSTALQFNTSLQSLKLNGCKLGSKGGILVASMLQVNRTIEHLELAATDMDTHCIIAMATVLHGNLTLKSVDLSRPLLHSKLEESTIHLSKMLQINSSLKEIHLCKHWITDTGVDWLCQYLTHNHSLTHLDISSNKLSQDGGTLLAGYLQNNPILTVLNLSCNRIEDEGLSAISRALRVNCVLTSLNVCYNHIGDRGLCELAKALDKNTTLSHVFIWGNQIGQPTCDSFSGLLHSCRLLPAHTDVQSYTVDGVTYLSHTQHTPY